MSVVSTEPVPGQTPGRKSLGLLLIKPSHYDDEGYVIQWWRSYLITNALAVVASLFTDAAERRAQVAEVSSL